MKVEFWEAKSWEAQRLFVGCPTVSSFCINIGDLEQQGDFFPVRQKGSIVRRTFFFAIKNYCLPVGESLVERSNVMLWIGER